MRPSLSVRLFLVHLAFTVAAGALAVVLVRRSFERYSQRWQEQVSASLTADLYVPVTKLVARSLLVSLEAEYPEVRERRRERISEGLRTVVKDFPAIRSVVVVDRDLRIQFASDPSVEGLAYTRVEDREFLGADEVRSRPGGGGSRDPVEELVVPVFDDRDAADAAPFRRLGSVLVRFVPDAGLVTQVTGRQMPSPDPSDFAFPVILFLAAAAVGGVAVAGLTGLPVRRLDRALAQFRARGFRGTLDINPLELDQKLAATVETINELGGRLAVLDARGREREALLASLSSSLEEGMLAVEPDGSPVAWNDAALRVLGCPQDGAAGPGDAAERGVVAVLRQTLAKNPDLWRSANVARVPRGREVAVVREDGSQVAVAASGIPFDTGSGETGVLLLMRDLATQRSIEAHLLDAGRFASIAHLAAGLAHEIRNPLHSIGLNATVIEEHAQADPNPERLAAVSESIESIKGESRRLAELLTSYLGLLRPESPMGLVDVREVCGRVIALLSFSARKSNVEIRLDGDEQLPRVPASADRLQQAVLNLTLNAIQAMPGGGSVSIRTRAIDGSIHIEVADTGPGVPEWLRPSLFDRAATTKPDGSGLGLPLVRIIAESHGGRVELRSGPGEGAVFCIVLPGQAE